MTQHEIERRRIADRFVIETSFDVHVPRAPGPRPLLVALHGMGQNAETFAAQIAPLINERRVVLIPDAPLPFEVTDKAGRRQGQAWYIYTGDQAAFLLSYARTEEYLLRVIERVRRDHEIDGARIAVLGYSQGGYVAGMMMLRNAPMFGALVAVAARLKDELPAAAAAAADETRRPILQLHGRQDRFVDLPVAERSAGALRTRGWPIDFVPLDTGHRLSADAVARADCWLSALGL